ncbi:F-box domain containing protein [Tanacetum coccineum]|uniref:F-box domain containing protein n=1 Tax=Tanacetum coccineum TaxID=301880 RepID=A0ABQ5A1R4_9ASTR
MSDHIPFEIQSEIMKGLPVKSLLQFRSVSKQWKSFIDNPEFIKTYHINHPNPKHHLLLQYNHVPTYTSIIDDNTFPQQKSPLTAPKPLNLLRFALILGSVNVLGNVLVLLSLIGFGVCYDTSDPKLVKINVVKTPSISWEVQVFTLSSRVWKTVYKGAPFKSCDLMRDHVFIDGIIYWRSLGSFILSFDLKSDKFGEVSIPESFVHTYGMWLAKVNESLGLLEFYEEGGMPVCGVWMRKDGVNKPFTKIYTVKVEGKSVLNTSVLGFRNNGEVVLQLDNDDFEESQIEVYEPSSGRINSVGISGENDMFSVWSYMETLLLLEQSNSIIH